MARRKRPPELSTITRSQTVAYSRKQKPEGGEGGGDEPEDANVTDADLVKAALATMKMPQQTDKPDPKPEPSDRPTLPFDPKMLQDVVAANKDDKDDPAPEIARARVETVGVPVAGFPGFGAPPEIPEPSSAGIVIKGGAVEEPTHMPGPREMPPGNPDDVASPPGFVPAGDSRSLRRRGDAYEFALIYRQGNAVISRVGIVGTRGVWRVVEYPTTASASHAYAKEASRFVSEGFSDYRE
jgi:hypothetical protein